MRTDNISTLASRFFLIKSNGRGSSLINTGFITHPLPPHTARVIPLPRPRTRSYDSPGPTINDDQGRPQQAGQRVFSYYDRGFSVLVWRSVDSLR